MRTALDMLTDFDAQAAMDAIGEACAEKHTGGDGERKFWPDVDVVVIVPISKDCK